VREIGEGEMVLYFLSHDCVFYITLLILSGIISYF
jgi:hypothetical protein